jgi:hypothetical protein
MTLKDFTLLETPTLDDWEVPRLIRIQVQGKVASTNLLILKDGNLSRH